MPNDYMQFLAQMSQYRWAIMPSVMEDILAAAKAKGAATGAEVEQLAASVELGEVVEGCRFTRVRGSVGSLSISGPLVPRAGFFAEMLGFVSVDLLAAEFRALEQDDSIKSIVLVINSPGGAIPGIFEFSNMIASCDKHVTAYVFGNAASAAYWVASAADEIVAAPTALVGSIGAMITVRTRDNDGEVTVISSQSPKKNLDPQSKEGKEELASLVDNLASVFIEDVAKNRNVPVSTVLVDFGQGALMIASEALSAGMVDSVDTLVNTVSQSERAGVEILTTAQLEPANEGANRMPTLQELIAQDPAVARELEALKKVAREEGAATERDALQAQAEQRKIEKEAKDKDLAVSILGAEEYKKIHHMALKVLQGAMDASALAAAQAAFDAFTASDDADSAAADSADEPDIVPQNLQDSSSEGDTIASEEDINAEVKEFRGEA